MDFLKPRLDKARTAVVNPYRTWIDEDYIIINVAPESPGDNAEFQEILAASISYYPNDLLVVGWSAAFVFDNPVAAGPTLQLLEYANTQLLEFRHYDELLTGVLAGVYRSIDPAARELGGVGASRVKRRA